MSLSTLTITDGIALLKIDSPPVNALSHAVRTALYDGLKAAVADPAVAAIIITCGGRMFFAGADITELGKPLQPPLLRDIMGVMEAAAKPVVATIHGSALGGGLELSLACSHRVAVPSAKLGLPEVALGLLPAAGGTQRLPRLIGLAAAADMIVFGRTIPAGKALDLGLIDRIVEENDMEAGAVAFARALVDRAAPLRRARDGRVDLTGAEAETLLARFRRDHPALFTGYRAPDHILRALQAACDLPLVDGLAQEAALSRALLNGPQSAAQRHIFFAERATAKVPDLAPEGPVPTIRHVHIQGTTRDAALLADLFRRSGLALCDPETADLLVEAADDGPLSARLRDAAAAAPLRLHMAAGALTAIEVMRGAGMTDAAVACALALARRLGTIAIVERPVDGFAIDRLRRSWQPSLTDLLAADDSIPAADMDLTGACRPLLALVDEAAMLLADGTVSRAADLDVAAVKVLGWPIYRGGPLFWGRQVGYGRIAAALDHLHEHSPAIARRPSPALRRLGQQEQGN